MIVGELADRNVIWSQLLSESGSLVVNQINLAPAYVE